jgi:hypothetical protein
LQIERSGIPLYGGIKGKDEFAGSFFLNAACEFSDGKIPGAYAFEGGNKAAEYMEEAAVFTGFFDDPQILSPLYNA